MSTLVRRTPPRAAGPRWRVLTVSVAVTAAIAATVAAQPPRIANGRLSAQPAAAPFAPSFRSLVSSQPDVAWIGYFVPVVDRERVMCCSGSNWVSGVMMSDGSSCCGACRLEQTSSGTNISPRTAPGAGGAVKLEGSERIAVMYRVADRRVQRIRVFSEDCELDAGGRVVQWLDNVRPADSVALLESFTAADADGRTRILDGAVTAIALHGDPAADAALDRLAAATQPESVRKKVTFWLGSARGRHGFDRLRQVMRDDPSVEVRKSAVFGLSQSSVPEAFDTLAAVAQADNEPRLRSEALFWLAQKGDNRAPKVIADALQKDPSAEVRKKAVFALSQLKEDSGVPALIQVARTHADPSTRGEAIFWLGQKAGSKVSGAIAERIDQDSDTEVKKKAVFALSRLPKEEGIPLLIKVARTNGNPAVRKQAMFWLGQSKDPRAIDFFAEILK
jgi:HEAT repeat protein